MSQYARCTVRLYRTATELVDGIKPIVNNLEQRDSAMLAVAGFPNPATDAAVGLSLRISAFSAALRWDKTKGGIPWLDFRSGKMRFMR